MYSFEQEITRFIESIRPPADIRDKLDIGYSFKNNTLTIHETRPYWRNPARKIDSPVAKARHIKSKNHWKIYWKRGNGQWAPYEPHPECPDLKSFFRILQKDQHGCFWG